MSDLIHVGDHAVTIANTGRDIGPGDTVSPDELGPEDQYLVDDGVLGHVTEDGPSNEPTTLTGDTLKERAAELKIEGRAKMNADQLREAIAAAESKGGDS